jgi:hypothetical protein
LYRIFTGNAFTFMEKCTTLTQREHSNVTH